MSRIPNNNDNKLKKKLTPEEQYQKKSGSPKSGSARSSRAGKAKGENAQKLVLEAADEKLLGLLQQTGDGFGQGIQANYMSGLQEMLALVKAPKTCFENPHAIVCKLLDLIIGDSVAGLESFVKAMLAEVAAKVIVKLLANNKEK